MFFNLFIKGLIIGIMVSIPLGPIGVLVVQRTVNKSRTAGLVSGLGAAFSDTLYAVIAGFSLTIIIDFIRRHQMAFQVLGALVILLLGLHIFFKNPVKDLKKYRRRGSTHLQDFASTFLITFSNPLAIFVFLAVFAGSGLVLDLAAIYQSFFIVFGVFVGAAIWWTALSGIVSLFRHRIDLRFMWWMNKIAGVLIWLFVIITLTVVLVKEISI